uniref:Uncharacterized protein n=1 Tax=Oryza barthii TaxID=65489 RepID=A0A0D3HLX8_9ORYZ
MYDKDISEISEIINTLLAWDLRISKMKASHGERQKHHKEAGSLKRKAKENRGRTGLNLVAHNVLDIIRGELLSVSNEISSEAWILDLASS